MKSVASAILIISMLFSINCIAEDTQQLGINKVCSQKYLDANTEQLCTNGLFEKATYVSKKFLLQAGSLVNYGQLKELNSETLRFNAGRSVCNLYDKEKYVMCIDKELDKASASIDKQNLALNNADINSLTTADLTKSANTAVVKIVDSKLNELNDCRLTYANKIDDNITNASDVASAVQAKCNYLANEFYNYSLLPNLSSSYDIFEEDYLDFATKNMFISTAVEKHFGQQATVALVLEQRATRKANMPKIKKSKTNKKTYM